MEAEVSQQPTPATARQLHALVLDDQEDIAAMLAEMTRLLGYEVEMTCEPRQALRMLEENSYDVVLSDFRMPEMNGEEFYRAAVSARPELARRIIFLSGDVVSEDTQEFFRGSGAPWIQKPFRFGQVQETIRKALAAV